jgi:hypothetical protein
MIIQLSSNSLSLRTVIVKYIIMTWQTQVCRSLTIAHLCQKRQKISFQMQLKK